MLSYVWVKSISRIVRRRLTKTVNGIGLLGIEHIALNHFSGVFLSPAKLNHAKNGHNRAYVPNLEWHLHITEILCVVDAVCAAGRAGIDHPDVDRGFGELFPEQARVKGWCQGQEGRSASKASGFLSLGFLFYSFWLGLPQFGVYCCPKLSDCSFLLFFADTLIKKWFF